MTQLPSTETRIPARLLPLLRIIWFGFAVVVLAIFFAGNPPRYAELAEVCQIDECIVLALNEKEGHLLAELGLSMPSYAVFQLALEWLVFVVFTVVAGLIFWGRSDTWIGYIISLTFLLLATIFFAEESRSLQRVYPAIEPLIDFLVTLAVSSFILLFFLFPDGKFAPRWLGWLAGLAIGILLLDTIVIRSEARGPSTTFVILITAVIGAALGIVSQIYRFRKVSNRIQRQQTKWVLAGFFSMFSMALVWTIFVEVFPLQHGRERLLLNLSYGLQMVLISFFPISMLISIFRYRLWDIDLVIRRTLVYSVLTALLALVYLGGVVGLQNLFVTFTGQAQSQLVTVITTLAIAAIFFPLRSRVQDFVDRSFYRRKYDSTKTLAEFAVTARDEVELDKLTERLIAVIVETMQPETIELKLRNISNQDYAGQRPEGKTPL